MKQKLIGILTIASYVLVIILAISIGVAGEFFRAANLKLLIVLIAFTLIITGVYLLKNHSPSTTPRNLLLIAGFGGILVILTGLSSFNIIPFLGSYNWLLAGGILYTIFVQIQLLNWGIDKRMLMKILTISVIVCNSFLVVFFIAEWSYHGLKMVVNLVAWISVLTFIIGLVLTKQKPPLAVEEINHQQ
jgi:hypothetical protein